MPAYVIAAARNARDPAAMEEYRRRNSAAVEQHGGRFLARGGDHVVLEGEFLGVERVVLIEFPDLATARAWYDSETYRAAREVREGAADVDLVAVAGV
jgi:uncharacterized protein (DUF1330 family)